MEPLIDGYDDGREDGICVEELHMALTKAIAEGHSQALVYFDTEARTFKCHYVRVNGACVSPKSENDMEDMFILTTRYH